jgi:glutamate dehydrogenase/leucine dehydrogenase
VAESIVHYYDIWGGSILGKRVIVQGWGNVASSAAYYLSKKGAKVVGIIDKEGGQINEDGFSFEEVKSFFLNKEKNRFISDYIESFESVNSKIWDLESDVFIPCAASRILTKDQVDRMINAGVELISAGANIPFSDKEVFFGPICEYVDSKISVIPDFTIYIFTNRAKKHFFI